MPTKEQINERLNELLGLEEPIDFTKLSKADMERLLEVLGNPSGLIQMGIKNLRARARREILERPIKDFMEKPIIEDILAGSREGPLGFGILPRILGRKRTATKTRKG